MMVKYQSGPIYQLCADCREIIQAKETLPSTNIQEIYILDIQQHSSLQVYARNCHTEYNPFEDKCNTSNMACSKPLQTYLQELSLGKLKDKLNMKYEGLRLKSFVKLPTNSSISAILCSKAGFYYSGIDDEVRCYSCGIKIKDWGDQDNPFIIHKKYSPSCPFVLNNSENIPLGKQCGVPYPNGHCGEKQKPVEMADIEHCSPNVGHVSDGNSVFDLPTNYNDTISPKHPRVNTIGNNDNAIEQNNQPGNPPTSNETQYTESNHNYTPGDYRYERARLESFGNWPSNAAVKPEDLARSGFYYTGIDDRVQCTFCRGILRNWEPGDQPDSEHRRHFGQCPFLTNPNEIGNVLLGNDNNRQNGPSLQPNYFPGIVTEKPVHETYALPAERLGTFKDFPSNMIQTPEQFTRAGFFYTGISDSVKCFFCDGGLRNWEPNDDPWTEHARWFPRCGFLRLCKGDEFIKDIQKRYSPPSMDSKPPQTRKHNKHKNISVDDSILTQRMRGRTVKAVLDMGCEHKLVKQVVTHRIQDFGDDFFPNAESLLDAICEYEEELKYNEMYGEPDTQHSPDETNDSTHSGKPQPNEAETEKKKKRKKKKNKAKNGDSMNAVGNSSPLQYINDEEAKQLSEDIQRMKDERLCKVCMDDEVNIVFLRCGHLVCCSNCAPALRHCPICRELIRGTVKVFIS